MKREIKFRAFHKPTGKIFQVYGWHKEYVFEETLDGMHTGLTNPAELIDCDLMQFTGLKDKNGQEIYEGDILKSNQGRIFKPVEFSEIDMDVDDRGLLKCICWNVEHSDLYGKIYHTALIPFDLLDLQQFSSNDCEVIGNRYDNPELLLQ